MVTAEGSGADFESVAAEPHNDERERQRQARLDALERRQRQAQAASEETRTAKCFQQRRHSEAASLDEHPGSQQAAKRPRLASEVGSCELGDCGDGGGPPCAEELEGPPVVASEDVERHEPAGDGAIGGDAAATSSAGDAGDVAQDSAVEPEPKPTEGGGDRAGSNTVDPTAAIEGGEAVIVEAIKAEGRPEGCAGDAGDLAQDSAVESEPKPTEGGGDRARSNTVDPTAATDGGEAVTVEETKAEGVATHVSPAALRAAAAQLEAGDAHNDRFDEFARLMRGAADRLDAFEETIGEFGQALRFVNLLSARALQGAEGRRGGSAAQVGGAGDEPAPRSFLVKKGDADLQEAHRAAEQHRPTKSAGGGGALSDSPRVMSREDMDRARRARLEVLEAQQAERKKEIEEAQARTRARESMFEKPFAGAAKPLGRQ